MDNEHIAVERMKQLSDGKLLYRLKKQWRNGTSYVIFDPLELMERLAMLVPAPRSSHSQIIHFNFTKSRRRINFFERQRWLSGGSGC